MAGVSPFDINICRVLARAGNRSLAQEVQQAAIAAIDVDGQRAPLANVGKSLETLCSGQNIFAWSVPLRRW